MGCNASNHAWDCNCGWGGDTGYGWKNHCRTSRPILAEPARPPVRVATTTPNARCPVCGDVVFFYVSPFGGRVFFDELGPPWPKHPCTDNPRRSVTLRTPLEIKRAPAPNWQWKRDDWTLLRNIDLRQEEGVAFLSGQGAKCSTSFKFGWQGKAQFTPDDPVYCRRSPSGTGEFELSYLPINARSSYFSFGWGSAWS